MANPLQEALNKAKNAVKQTAAGATNLDDEVKRIALNRAAKTEKNGVIHLMDGTTPNFAIDHRAAVISPVVVRGGIRWLPSEWAEEQLKNG